ncbi:MAG: GIY-YIG nuclease family protein [Synergistaceae bacterium]|nr:GIY-YIG nuclease family protein [Synergistaceae bacterium]
MEKKARKELIRRYNERKLVGGIYVVRNTRDGTLYLDASADIRASRSRFDFSQKAGICQIAKLKKDWDELGAGAFVLDVLEEYVKDESSSDSEFMDDLGELKSLWREKLSREGSSFYSE